MGLFDRFRRKAADPIAEAVRGREPRDHHYELAHLALRQVAFDHPLAYFGVLASPDAGEFLTALLADVDKQCQGRGTLDFGVEDIEPHPVRLEDGRLCMVVEMPTPRGITEAHFTAAVMLAAPEAVEPNEKPAVRYFTLELGLGETPRTVLCEWTADGAHLNYGDGPPADISAFVGAVEQMLNRPPASH